MTAWPGGPGQAKVVFDASKSYGGSKPFSLPCGQCVGCRVRKAQEWAVRMSHEASLHDDNCFLTLTYSDEFLPEDGSISKRALQLFFKRFRTSIAPHKISYFAVGEYGGENGRPHYHAIVFNYAFPDKTIWRKAPSGEYLYRSPSLEKIWTFGNAEIGTLTMQSAGYVARYNLKKVAGGRTGNKERPHPVTGELFWTLPEFAVMSKRPAIGARWYQAYRRDAFPSDFVVIDGRKHPVPKFYQKLLKRGEPEDFTTFSAEVGKSSAKLIRKRREEAQTPSRLADSTPERLAAREESQMIRMTQLKREL